MHQQLESAKCVCYDLTPTKTHPYRHLPVNFNLLLLQQITFLKHEFLGSHTISHQSLLLNITVLNDNYASMLMELAP